MRRRLPFLLLIAFLVLPGKTPAWAASFEARTIDGTRNNPLHPDYGSTGAALLRLADNDYADSVETPARPYARSAREISNILAAQEKSILNTLRASDFVWQWGQFLDHDLDLTPEAHPQEPFYIPVPPGDPYFDPYADGNRYITLFRSVYHGGESRRDPRQQLNMVTAFIDASQVYGSDETRARALRTFEGGMLKTTNGGQFLPLNTEDLDNSRLFLAGDVRANEQIALTAMHTLFVREHNRLCKMIAASEKLSDEEIYQRARKIVGALMQVITYREFLPAVFGSNPLPPYKGYEPNVNPGICNEFSTAAFRFGHSMLSPALLRVNMPGNELVSIPLKDAFFNPKLIYQGGIEPLLRGLATQQAQEVDTMIVDGVRNFLFGAPGDGGFDLASLNLQRSRDHGLADYNGIRKAFDLKPAKTFSDITSDPEVQMKLYQAYGNVAGMDPWITGLAEEPLPGSLVGETFFAIYYDQFLRLRNGDRFWYQNDPYFKSNPALMKEVEKTRLSDVIRRNTLIGSELQENVFKVRW